MSLKNPGDYHKEKKKVKQYFLSLSKWQGEKQIQIVFLVICHFEKDK